MNGSILEPSAGRASSRCARHACRRPQRRLSRSIQARDDAPKAERRKGLGTKTWKPSLDLLGSAAGARLDPALKDRACSTQEGQTVCGLAKATVITVSSFCKIRLRIQGLYRQAHVNLSARRNRLFCNQGTSGRMKDYRCPLRTQKYCKKAKRYLTFVSSPVPFRL
jgi:hypothetical protein